MQGTSNATAAHELTFCEKVIAALIATIAGSAKGNHAGQGREVTEHAAYLDRTRSPKASQNQTDQLLDIPD